MTDRFAALLYIAVIASFATVVMLEVFGAVPDRAIGALLVGCGLVAIIFARRLSAAKRELSNTPPNRAATMRPFTLVLWGSGLVLLGFLYAFGL